MLSGNEAMYDINLALGVKMKNQKDVLRYIMILIFLQHASYALADSDLWWPEFQLPPLEWTNEVKPSLSEAQLTNMLQFMGVQFGIRAGGLTYTSMVSTSNRDYLFCNDKLYALVEGGFFTGKEFIQWFQTFLSAHMQYGEPAEYIANEQWGTFHANWVLEDGSNLIFQLRSNLTDKQGWTRQLYSNEVEFGGPCLE